MLKVSKMRSTRLKIIEPLSETEIHTISKGKTDLIVTPYYVIFQREMEEKARDEEEDRKNREFKEEKQRQAEQVISEKQAKGKY